MLYNYVRYCAMQYDLILGRREENKNNIEGHLPGAPSEERARLLLDYLIHSTRGMVPRSSCRWVFFMASLLSIIILNFFSPFFRYPFVCVSYLGKNQYREHKPTWMYCVYTYTRCYYTTLEAIRPFWIFSSRRSFVSFFLPSFLLYFLFFLCWRFDGCAPTLWCVFVNI